MLKQSKASNRKLYQQAGSSIGSIGGGLIEKSDSGNKASTGGNKKKETYNQEGGQIGGMIGGMFG